MIIEPSITVHYSFTYVFSWSRADTDADFYSSRSLQFHCFVIDYLMCSTTHYITFFLEDKKETMLSGYFFGDLRLVHDFFNIHQPYSAVFDNC